MKNNKKGFTLIELLAVIVVLSIIMVIATGQVTKTINEARKNSFTSSFKMVEKEFKRKLAEQSLDYTEETINCTDCLKAYDLSASDYELTITKQKKSDITTEVYEITDTTIVTSLDEADVFKQNDKTYVKKTVIDEAPASYTGKYNTTSTSIVTGFNYVNDADPVTIAAGYKIVLIGKVKGKFEQVDYSTGGCPFSETTAHGVTSKCDAQTITAYYDADGIMVK